jgi:hypothetical protein
MDTRLQALAGRQHGTFTASQAAQLGVPDHELRRAVSAGELVRVRRQAYVSAAVWTGAAPEERYRVAAVAIARTRPGDALSHHAALAVWGLPLWAADLDRLDLVSDVRQVTHRRGLALHPARGLHLGAVEGVPVVSVARALVRTAVSMGRDCAVVAGDAALHRNLITVAELIDEVARLSPHEGRGRAMEAVLHLDGKSESVGESLTRLVLDDLGLGYESQVVIRTDSGRFVGRVDFLVEGVVLEFDGRSKYQRAGDGDERPSGSGEPGQVVWLEKRREDEIRREGYPVERVVWDDLARPGLIGLRIKQAKRLAGRPKGEEQRPSA